MTEASGVLRPGSAHGSDLQRGDGLVGVHQVRHDGLQRAVPLAGGSRTRTGVRPELAHFLVVRLLAVVQRQQASGRRVLQKTERASAGRQHQEPRRRAKEQERCSSADKQLLHFTNY